MRIIIAGAGEVGSHLAKMLSTGANDLTIIDADENRLNKLSESADVITVVGDPTSIAVLERAGVPAADLFIAVSPAKAQDVNIISALLAKKLGAKKVTARVNNDEYMKYENKLLFTEMGIDLLFYPEKIASYEIIDLLKQTGTTEFMEFSRGALQMVVVRLDDGAPLINKTEKDICTEEHKDMFKPVAIARNGNTIIPDSETKFMENDQLFLICTRDGVREALKISGKHEIEIKSIMIVGGGRIGEMLAKKMQNVADTIKIIEQRPERCEYLADTLSKCLIINGDGRNSDLLIEEGIKDFDAFVAVTSNSEINILSSVAAKKMGVQKTIAEVENLEYIKLAEGMGVDAVINKKLATAGRIFRFTLSNKVRSIKCLNGSDAEILEFIVSPDSDITKAPLGLLKFPKEAIIGGITRGEEGIIMHADTMVRSYDKVVVFALPQVLSRVNRFFI